MTALERMKKDLQPFAAQVTFEDGDADCCDPHYSIILRDGREFGVQVADYAGSCPYILNQYGDDYSQTLGLYPTLPAAITALLGRL